MKVYLSTTKRSTIRLLLSAVMTCCPIPTADAESYQIHVSPTGQDTNPGTLEQPVATLEKARDLLRSHNTNSQDKTNAVVRLHPGTYMRTKPFQLTSDDSAKNGGSITYQAEPATILLGAHEIPAEAFHPVRDQDVMARLPENARKHVVELDLKSLGISNAKRFPEIFRDSGGIIGLFIDGQRLPLARWPNDGYTNMKSVLDSGSWGRENRRGGTFFYRDERPASWQKAVEDGLWLKGFWRVPWEPETVRVSALDPAAGTMTQSVAVGGGLGSKYSREVNGTRPGNGQENWYALNLLEELDRPGEWCLRFSTGMLYLWPPRDLKDASIHIADMSEALVTFDNVSGVSLQGITLEGGLGNGVEINGGSDVLIAGCEFLNFGGTGVVIRGGKRHRVVSCDLHHLGEGGIYVEGGDRPTLTPANHEILNNHIYHVGEVKTTYAPAVKLGAFGFTAVGCRVAHNLIHDLPHAAILYGGNDNILEYNEIWRVAQDSGDVGAFYTTYDWTSRGNVLRYNLVADSPHCNAFYMDDGDSGDTVTGNVVWRTNYGPFIGGGHDNTVTGNLIIECMGGIHMDDRGVSRGYNAKNRTLSGQLEKMDYRNPPWSERYPKLIGLLVSHPDWPTGNKIEGNVLVGCGSPLHLSGNKEHMKLSVIKNNPQLSRSDAGLPEQENPIASIRSRVIAFPDVPGFAPIPMAKIGMFKDEFRKKLPQAEENPSAADDRVFDSQTDIEESNHPR